MGRDRGKRRKRGEWAREAWAGSGLGGRDGEGAAKGLFPGGEALGDGDLVLDGGEAVEEELADVGEDGGVAARDAILREESEESAEDVVDVAGGLEFAGEGGEFGGDAVGFEELALFAGVDEAEVRVGGRVGQAAFAAVGEGVLAESGFRGFGSFHGLSP
jgi:hypothetical protein